MRPSSPDRAAGRSASDADMVATGRLRVDGTWHSDPADGHALIASNGPSDSLTWDVPPSMGGRRAEMLLTAAIMKIYLLANQRERRRSRVDVTAAVFNR